MQEATLWQNRNFRLVFSASAVSNLGDGVSALALPWLATLLTREPWLIGLIATAGRLPWLLFALPAGVLTDRADLRRLVMRMDVLRCGLTVAVLVLAFSGLAGGVAIAVLAALTFLLGTAEVLRDNAAQTLLPRIVVPAALERANGLMWSVEEVMGRLIGPPLAGVLIGVGIALPFGLDATTFALSALAFALVVLPPATAVKHKAFWPALREGFGFLWRHDMLRRLALVLGAVNGLYAGSTTALVLYGQERLGLSAQGYGLFLAAGAAGGVIGGLVGPGLAARLGANRSIRLALLAMAVGYALLAATPHAAVASAGLFLEAFAGLLWNIVTVSWRQRIIPPALMGRVNSAYRFFGTGAMAMGAMAGGFGISLAEASLGRLNALTLPFWITAAAYLTLWLYAKARIRLA